MNAILSGAIAEGPVTAHTAVHLVYRDIPINPTCYALPTRGERWEALVSALLMLSGLAAIAACFSSALLSLAS
jgi:hypothetical protein